MKLVYFDDFRLGILKNDSVYDVSFVAGEIPHTGPHDLMTGLISQFDRLRARLESATVSSDAIPVESVRLRPPLPRPDNIVCMALNYIDSKIGPEPAPIDAFTKSSGSIIGPDETMILPDFPALAFEGEAEMAVVIGKRASNVSATDAMDHVFGYVNFIDGSARGTPSLFQMKARQTFAPIGPYLVTADEIPDPHNLRVRLWVNGVLRQDFSTGGMAHRIPRCIEWVSSVHALEPGDILATGTSHDGLSSFQDGDEVELETEGLGKLRIRVRDDLKRTWERDTWLERKRKQIPESAVRQLSGKYGPRHDPQN
ncbi:2-keto-4-pentenoate hydratase/2-oxohepta-3-ene-1,7-dioic acid hydratase (catechol pathway) [Burkholderia sp. D7]|nr:2-keto-4-pentenoate hydratase/2-oxohepta-3-ene-1,7-dioic acid hydratase (catechol pathway) [Burkholderia sp. D7]